MRHGRLSSVVVAGLVLLAGCSSSAGDAANTAESVDTGDTSETTRLDGDPGSEAVATTAAAGEPTAGASEAEQVDAANVGRADITAQGNRVADGRGGLDTADPIDVAVEATPIWVLPIERPDGRTRWLAVLDDNSTVVIDQDGTVTDAGPYAPPSVLDQFDDPLPDGRVVSSDGVEVALVGPTNRYPHGVLGDRLEASAITVRSPEDGSSISFGPEAPTVIEGLSPLLADVDLDGTAEILVTHSNAEVGAWLALWSLDGDLIAESQAIGLGNRWRNQLAIAPVGPNGEVEVIDVRTPHLGGTVEYFRLDGDELVRVATQTGYTSHRIGSRNLDLGIVADATGDGTLNVVVPTDDRRMLGILRRTDGETDGVAVDALLDLPGRLTTNVAVQAVGDGGLAFAVGTNEGVVRMWPAP